MTEYSLYFFKKTSDGFLFIQVPLDDQTKIQELIDTEIMKTETEEHLDYFRNYDKPLEMQQLCSVSSENLSQEISSFITEVVLNNTTFDSIESYSPRSNAKDKYNFSGFAILKKDSSGEFEIGIESIQESYKLYKKEFLGFIKLGNDRTIEDTSSTMLIPKTLSISVKGNWQADSVSQIQVFFRNKAYKAFERLFNYQDLWKGKADELLEESGQIEVNADAWKEYKGNLKNARNFVRCMNVADLEPGFRNVSSYFEMEELRERLGFEVNSNNGDFQVKIDSVDQMKKFVAAFNKKIVHHPIDLVYGSADHLEKFD